MTYPYPYPDNLPNPICPKCKRKMAKAGPALSGHNKIQRWKCSTCGITTIKEPKGKEEK